MGMHHHASFKIIQQYQHRTLPCKAFKLLGLDIIFVCGCLVASQLETWTCVCLGSIQMIAFTLVRIFGVVLSMGHPQIQRFIDSPYDFPISNGCSAVYPSFGCTRVQHVQVRVFGTKGIHQSVAVLQRRSWRGCLPGPYRREPQEGG